MARSSLDDFEGSIIDPAQPWNFQLRFLRLPSGVGSTKPLTVRCQATTLPGVTMETVVVGLHGMERRFRGRRTYSGEFNVTFAENVDWSTYQIFRNWHNMMLSWENNTGSSSQLYKMQAELVTMDDAGNEQAAFQIYGIWPSAVGDISFDGSAGGDYVRPEITFAYDRIGE